MLAAAACKTSTVSFHLPPPQTLKICVECSLKWNERAGRGRGEFIEWGTKSKLESTGRSWGDKVMWHCVTCMWMWHWRDTHWMWRVCECDMRYRRSGHFYDIGEVDWMWPYMRYRRGGLDVKRWISFEDEIVEFCKNKLSFHKNSFEKKSFF